VALVRTDVSEDCIASIIRVERISELGTTLPSQKTAYFSHHRENLKSYKGYLITQKMAAQNTTYSWCAICRSDLVLLLTGSRVSGCSFIYREKQNKLRGP
jgi:hypothetical protein